MITFQNEGLIDTRAITIMGVSSKEGKNPIGYFGTGLKYAVAIILREGGTVRIWRGLEELRFETRRERIRVNDFDLIYMNDRELGFTTDLGKNWQTWMAFREIYCNTMDEGGICTTARVKPRKDKTTIMVSHDDFMECYEKRSSFILETRPIYAGDGIEMHPGKSQHLYYRGMLAGELDRVSAHTYNITAASDLTEDRTLKNMHLAEARIATSILSSHDESFIERMLTQDDGLWENKLQLDHGYFNTEPSKTVMRVMERLSGDYTQTLNYSAQLMYRRRLDDLAEPEQIELNRVQRLQLRRAVEFCKKMGYQVDKDPIFFIKGMSANRLAQAEHIPNKRVIISERVFEMGTKILVHALLEEHWHLELSYTDESRDFQNFLIDKIVSLQEELDGEPL